jgi:hypothetical protein
MTERVCLENGDDHTGLEVGSRSRRETHDGEQGYEGEGAPWEGNSDDTTVLFDQSGQWFGAAVRKDAHMDHFSLA